VIGHVEGGSGGQMIGSIGTALSGMNVGTTSLDIAASNVANISTPGYQQRSPVVAERQGGGAAVTGVFESQEPGVDIAGQMVQSMMAEATVKANVTTVQAASDAYRSILEMSK
jgi:flagellar basal body rod protein FlgC